MLAPKFHVHGILVQTVAAYTILTKEYMVKAVTPEMYRAVSFQFRMPAFLMSFTLAIDHTMFPSVMCSARIFVCLRSGTDIIFGTMSRYTNFKVALCVKEIPYFTTQ